MKKFFLSSIFIVLFSAITFAQNEDFNNLPQTIFSDGSRLTGWFIDFSNSYSEINGKYSYLPTFAGGVVMNNNFRVGFAAKSLTCHETYLRFENLFDETAYLNGGYAGLYLEASPMDNKVLHVSFPVIIGGGGAVYLSRSTQPDLEDFGDWDFQSNELASSPFFVIEPGVNLEINITGFMKFHTGFSYRWVNGLDLQYTSRTAFNNGSFNMGLMFGKF